jgi:hypothetical protein
MTANDQTSPVPSGASNGAPDRPLRSTSMSWRSFWMTTGGMLISLAALVVFLEYFVAHRLPPLTEATLDAAEKRWAKSAPPSYNLDLEIRGAMPGPVHVEVRNGEVVAMQRNGVTPDQRRVWDVWTVPGQFETLEQEMELAADPVGKINTAADTRLSLQCEFDPRYGFPRQYHRLVYGGGQEVYWRTVKFEPQ